MNLALLNDTDLGDLLGKDIWVMYLLSAIFFALAILCGVMAWRSRGARVSDLTLRHLGEFRRFWERNKFLFYFIMTLLLVALALMLAVNMPIPDNSKYTE